ncbi:MAG TPA: hypothetical protein PKX92_08960 [Edaphocola sp.]|nr:hypothetical protein [Edaphocola sp.]
MKDFFRLFVLTFLTALTACNSDEKIEGYTSHEILVVTLDIEEDLTIEKITLRSSFGLYTDSILGKEIGNKTTIKLKCPQKGEGTFSICVFTNKDTLCSQDSYIEGGYRPRLKLKNNKFETLKWH